MAGISSLLGVGPPPSGPSAPSGPPPIAGVDYLVKLRKYLGTNLPRLAPPVPRKTDAGLLAQGYTILTLGLDPSSAPLSRAVKVPLTLGFGTPAQTQRQRPLLLRLPPDKLLYLLLRWQSLPQALPHVGRTDVPVPDGVGFAARTTRADRSNLDGDVESVRSWVGTIRSVSTPIQQGFGGWWGKPKEVDEDKLLLELYRIFNTLPGLLIHPPFGTDSQIDELLDAGGYTAYGGVDVRVPLDVLRNLQILELDAFDPRGLLIPPNPLLHSLTVHDIEDADEWIEELLVDLPEKPSTPPTTTADLSPLDSPSDLVPRFPNLRFLSLHHTSLLNLPPLPLTSLTHLDLSNNLLNSIPDALHGMHNLVSLNLSNNLITSVRNAPAALGNIHTINLARNRIDCLVGLDRVLGLRRVDVRGNALAEAGEVGRLAVLPHVEAVWAAENPLTNDEDWRAEIAASFVAEERSVVLDDTPLAWSELRRVDAILAARGRRRKEADTPAPAAPAGPEPEPQALSPPRSGASSPAHNPLVPRPATRVLSPAPSPAKPGAAAAGRRRPRRRVVNLDGDGEPEDSGKLNASTSTVGSTPKKDKQGKKKGHKRRESVMSINGV